MAYFNIPENPEFTKEVRKFETTDPAHANLFNNVVQALINNDVFIKKMAEQFYATAVANSESYANKVYQQATGYTDQEIAGLINGAPSTLDTLGEIARAMENNKDVVEALDTAIGSRVSEAEFDSHKKETEKLLGNTDISAIGDGTVTGAISELNTGIISLHGAWMQVGSTYDDCNKLPIGYCGYTYGDTKNSPGSGMMVQCLGLNDNYKFQIAAGVSGFYYRHCLSGTWKSWAKVV